ncbi:hypothetical protein E6W39_18980 [Kitasatospora acidiphila]|uniref:Uncharacterized protein n=1 Tax=Kitasatospora acidiphila TaxID=2567942 RepID=A0A540W4J6_9ACTN|nr:hypothetical protein [Kitasatospora acidiphila]TQF03936.1 hypothetical protein E6W39_18980 [Kitasatospora acidiphila]
MTLVITGIPVQALAYISLNVTGLTGYDTVAVQRTNADGSQVIVRSCNYISTGGADSWAGFDLEASLGVVVSYTVIAQTHNGDGSITTATASSGGLIIPTQNGVGWLKNLSQAALNTQISLQALSDVKTDPRIQVYPVIGRKNPVVVSDVRGGRTGTVSLMTTGSTDYQAVSTLLASGSTLFLQATPADGFSDMYFVAGSVTEHRPAAQSTDYTRIFNIDFTEVDSPSGSLTSIPGNSYAAVVSFGTYQALLNDRTTYLGVLNTPWGLGPGGN